MNTSSPMIIIGILFSKNPQWRSLLTTIPATLDNQLGLFLQGMGLEDRKEIYRLFEASSIKKIPYVQLASDTQEWEVKFFVEKFSTSVFSLPAVPTSLPIIDHWPLPTIPCLLENASLEIKDSIFTMETMSRPAVKGVCLNIGALETKRLRQPKLYQIDIAVLDHQTVSCVLVSPIPHSTIGRLLAKPNRLQSLSDLRYLKHFPPKYFSTMMVLQLGNSFAEQLEVKLYLTSVFGGSV